MKFSNLSLATIFLLTGNFALAAKSKTATPEKIPDGLITAEPYRYNGVVLSELGQGSGFCAWNNKTFFSAAHVVYGSEWAAPPIWYPSANSDVLDEKTKIPSRGYYRWQDYSALIPVVSPTNPKPTNFGYDVILAFAFERLIKGQPSTLNLNGLTDLKKKSKTLITGYPTKNAYDKAPIKGFFLHQTGPVTSPYEEYEGNSLTTTLVTSGPGNSGGPIWTQNGKSKWAAAGILVGGLPSETVVYGFSKDTNSLLQAVTPVLQPGIGTPEKAGEVTSFSTFFSYNQRTKIPDGRKEWTSFRIPVKTFPSGSTIKSVLLSLKIRTLHRGDLFVILEGPQGLQAVLPQALIHNEEGGMKHNLVVTNKLLTDSFANIDPKGNWYLRVQDRLKGDIATLQSIVLEIATNDVLATP